MVRLAFFGQRLSFEQQDTRLHREPLGVNAFLDAVRMICWCSVVRAHRTVQKSTLANFTSSGMVMLR